MRRRHVASVAVLVLAAVQSACGPAASAPPEASSAPTPSPGAAQTVVTKPPPGRIAFTRLEVDAATHVPKGADLWSIATDGSDLVRLTDLPELEGFPAWSPDGARLAFTRFSADSGGDIWIIDADPTSSKRHLRQLTNEPLMEGAPAWSPDGTQIAYVADWQSAASIWIRAADGSGAPRHVIEGNWPSWTPDGKRLLVTLGVDFKDTSLAYVSVDGGDPEPLPIQTPNASEGSISSQGQIGFVSSPNDYAGDAASWNEDIYTIGYDGVRGPMRITNTTENDHWPPSWSPSGDWFAYTHDLGELASRIAIVYGTEEPLYLTDGAFDLWPAWQPESAS